MRLRRGCSILSPLGQHAGAGLSLGISLSVESGSKSFVVYTSRFTKGLGRALTKLAAKGLLLTISVRCVELSLAGCAFTESLIDAYVTLSERAELRKH